MQLNRKTFRLSSMAYHWLYDQEPDEKKLNTKRHPELGHMSHPTCHPSHGHFARRQPSTWVNRCSGGERPTVTVWFGWVRPLPETGRRCGLGPMRSASYVNSKCMRSMSEPATTTRAASATSMVHKFDVLNSRSIQCKELYNHVFHGFSLVNAQLLTLAWS